VPAGMILPCDRSLPGIESVTVCDFRELLWTSIRR